jgi:hypothetical protein
MSTIKNPVGPESPQTYWRRRLMVLVGLLAVIIVIALIVTRPDGGSSANDSTDQTTSANQEPAEEDDAAEPVAGAACSPTVIAVEAETDAEEYAEGQEPLLSLTITNTGSTACTFGVGTDVQEYSISSGDDLIWSSKDCQVDPAPLEQLIEPGASLPTTPFAWDRTRSDPSTCDAPDSTQVTAGGATYQLAVAVNGVESEASKKFLLN